MTNPAEVQPGPPPTSGGPTLKRVGAQYVKANDYGCYAYDVEADVNLGDFIVDELGRVAQVVAPRWRYDGRTLEHNASRPPFFPRRPQHDSALILSLSPGFRCLARQRWRVTVVRIRCCGVRWNGVFWRGGSGALGVGSGSGRGSRGIWAMSTVTESRYRGRSIGRVTGRRRGGGRCWWWLPPEPERDGFAVVGSAVGCAVAEGVAAAAGGCDVAEVDDGSASPGGGFAGAGVHPVVGGAVRAAAAVVAAAGGDPDARGRRGRAGWCGRRRF